MVRTTNTANIFVYAGLLFGVMIIIYGIHELTSTEPAVVPVAGPAQQSAGPANILAAHQRIPRGHTIAKDDLESVQPRGPRPATAEASIETVIGKTAVTDIPAGAAILSSLISSNPAAAGLAPMIPIGYRAIEMRTTDETAVGNFIRAGDHVDIELVLRENVLPKQTDAQEKTDGNPSEARTVLQDVPVLTVGEVIGVAPQPATPPDNNGGRKAEPPHAVTLAMTPDQIAQFTLARSLGTLHLALRNPADLEAVVINASTLADIRGATPPSAAAVAQGKRPIELITGSKMRHIFSTNPSDKQ